MSPLEAAGVVPPRTVAVLPSDVVSSSPLGSFAAATQWRVVRSKNRWWAVVWMTWSPWAVWILRSYRSVSWLTMTAEVLLAFGFTPGEIRHAFAHRPPPPPSPTPWARSRRGVCET